MKLQTFKRLNISQKSENLSGDTISGKIRRSILSIALCCSIVIGITGVICIGVINSQSQQIYNDNLTPSTPLYLTESSFQSIRSDLKSLAIEESANVLSGTDYTDEINGFVKNIDKQLAAYSKMVSGEQEQNNYKAIASYYAQYKAQISTLEGLISNNDMINALRIIQNTDVLAVDLNQKINEAFQLNARQAAQRNTLSLLIMVLAIGLIILFTAAFILLAIRISGRIAKAISDPIEKMAAAAESIADGNLAVDLKVNSNDETATLARAFGRIINSLRLMKSDIDMMINKSLDGILDVRADTSRQKGDYRAILEGVNRMFDTVKEPLDVASDFINRLADGEHQPNLENNYKGYYAVLIGDLNHVRASFELLIAESDKLAQAGRNGQLDVRGDESSLKGGYAQIIRGVNDTFNAIKEPLDIASVFINNLAEGIAQQPLENSYKGYYAVLIDNLNKVRQSLRILLNESEKLSAAGAQGDLSVRGDESSVKGVYAGIIRGMNNTMSAIVTPLKESAVVLGNFAKNDFTQGMNGQYSGDFAQFKDSINEVRNRLIEVETVVVKVSEGNTDSFEIIKEVGKRSDHDRINPSFLSMLQTIRNLIAESHHLEEAAVNGELKIRGDEERFKGEYRSIVSGMNRTMAAFSQPIEEASEVLKEFAQGDLTVSVKGNYKGEYNQIKTSLNHAIESLSGIISEISLSAANVASSSKQISTGSQSLSQGAAEQASTVEELVASVAEISMQTKENAQSAAKADTLSVLAQENAAQGNQKMHELLESIQTISESSSSISKIIKVIDDIAFQTNILALNAAVEAARAGQFGKGFAVVAEEVRNLAAKSADAAKDTTALIENSTGNVNTGIKIANETAEMLANISGNIKDSAELVRNIAKASNEQAAATAQIDKGLSGVYGVVQSTSATAQESAASSEELSAQAELLLEIVKKFRLNR